MAKRMKRKAKRKSGFTLVELVIVIAILAILAAIAIPVITTTINSSKMSVMESDCETINIVIKEAMMASMAQMDTVVYDGKKATDAALTVGEVLEANELDLSVLNSKIIGGKTYCIVWSASAKNAVVSQTTTPWADTYKVKDLIPS